MCVITPLRRQIVLVRGNYPIFINKYLIKDPRHPALAKYDREEGMPSIEEAVRKLAALPAENLSLEGRGRLAPGYFADVAIFDPEKIQDHAVYDDPHHYATGMVHVLVNGDLVLEDGGPTGATPGRFVKGPGAQAFPESLNTAILP